MKTDAPAELPAYFPVDGDDLLGVLTFPSKRDEATCVVVLGGGQTASTTTGRNRVFVTLSRRVVALGYHAFRFDYHGIGDSTGTSVFRLDQPFVGDLDGAMQFLRRRGMDRFVLVGSCFGARTAMAAAHRVQGLEGVVLLAPPLRDFALSERRTQSWTFKDYAWSLVRPSRLVGGSGPVPFRRYVRFLGSGARVLGRRLRERVSRSGSPTWLSAQFVKGVSSLVDRSVPTLFIYGTEDDSYPDFQEARAGRLGELVDRTDASVLVEIVSGQVHGFTQTQAQDVIVETVMEWISHLSASGRDEPSMDGPRFDP